MKRMLAGMGLIAVLAVPTGAVGKPDESNKPAAKHVAFKNAAKECKAERSDPDFAGDHDGKTFEQHYGTNPNGRNAFGKCVSKRARGEAGPN